MKHFVAYHSARVMGRTYSPGESFKFYSRKPRTQLQQALGGWAWVILGEEGQQKTQYKVMGVYSPTDVASDAEGFVISGPGSPFVPAIDVTDEGWFQDLLRLQNNFSFGFSPVRNVAIEGELDRILANEARRALDGPAEQIVEVFHGVDGKAHDNLQLWRRAHADGFILNCLTASRALLHRVECPHLGDATWTADVGQDLARQRKVCSCSLQPLLDWAQRNSVGSLKACSDCRPSDDATALAAAGATLVAHTDFAWADVGDARRHAFASIVRRQGQPAFRRALLESYNARCAFTGCTVNAVLEAAHIVPYRGVWTNHPQNGLLLRADVHTMFDLGLVAVEPSAMRILVAVELRGTSYEALSGAPVAEPSAPELRPSKWALEQHRRRSGLTALNETWPSLALGSRTLL